MGKQSIIYIAINKINGKLYVGYTVEGLKERLRKHIWWMNHHEEDSSHFHKAIRKYGLDSFHFVLIEYPQSVLKQKEIEWIKRLDCKAPNGYNLTDGGDGSIGRKASEETRQRMREAQKAQDKSQPRENGKRMRKTYLFIDKYGNEYIHKGLLEFCRLHKLNDGTMCQILSGKRKHHKGWKIKKIESETVLER